MFWLICFLILKETQLISLHVIFIHTAHRGGGGGAKKIASTQGFPASLQRLQFVLASSEVCGNMLKVHSFLYARVCTHTLDSPKVSCQFQGVHTPIQAYISPWNINTQCGTEIEQSGRQKETQIKERRTEWGRWHKRKKELSGLKVHSSNKNVIVAKIISLTFTNVNTVD